MCTILHSRWIFPRDNEWIFSPTGPLLDLGSNSGQCLRALRSTDLGRPLESGGVACVPLWSRPGLPHGRHPRSAAGLRTRPAISSRPDYQPAGGQEVADSRFRSSPWRYAFWCSSTIFLGFQLLRGCFRSLCLCRGAFGQLLAFGSHSLLDVTTLSSATTCPVLLPCDPVTAL